MIHEAGEDDEYDYYIVHHWIGVSHVVKRKKGESPQIGCVGAPRLRRSALAGKLVQLDFEPGSPPLCQAELVDRAAY